MTGKTQDRRERRYSETRREILRAARRVVATSGARDCSVRDIAEVVGFSAPALYRYFPGGKEDILVALARENLAFLGRHLRRVPAELPPEERIIELGLVYLEFAREHGEDLGILFERLAAVEAEDRDPAAGPLDADEIFAIVDQAFRDAVDAGVLVAREPADVVLMWHGAWSLLHGMSVVEKLHPHHEEMYRSRARDLLQAFINGLKTDWTREVV
jgi:AcrR family transcriptional regulator